MIINEIFYSLQGEGLLAGVPSIFIRLAGCPLRCKWCDTKYALSGTAGQQYSITEITRQLQSRPCNNIVITGGEPMINPELSELVRQLKALDKHITIETSGIQYIPDLQCDLMSISPKLSNSVEEVESYGTVVRGRDLNMAILTKLIDSYDYQLKFVVDSPNDLDEIGQTVEELKNVDIRKVMLMPQAVTPEELIQKSPMVADLCKRTGFTFCQRLHVLLWGNEKGR
jgi:7-carboxy-7-deazaguanine synthase